MTPVLTLDPRRWRRRVLFAVAYLLFLLLLLETGARLFWKSRGVPFFSAPTSLYASFYPRMAERRRQGVGGEEPCFDVLLLGASALHPDYGDIAVRLRDRLTAESNQCVRLHNLAEPAHTTLDSYYKYKHLTDMHVDLVVIYHGINEVRANNCPAEVFRADYSHFAWYRLIQDAEEGASSRWFVLPYTMKFVALKTASRLGWDWYLPTHEPDETSMAYGCEVKTAASFRRHIEGILAMAAERRESVMLMTFAYYLPDGYSPEKFKAKELDYAAHRFPVELWGRPDCVVKALEAHNAEIVSLAGQSRSGVISEDALKFKVARGADSTGIGDEGSGVWFVDQQALMPDEGAFFDDICHFSQRGCERFVENMLPLLRSAVKEWASR